jgi:bacterioferritin (cytochrome b1)
MPAGNPDVINALRSSLRLHWQAIEFYAAYAAWIAPQYPKLGTKYATESAEERGHAEALLDRLRFFREPGVFDHADPVVPTEGFGLFLSEALTLETAAAMAEEENVTICRQAGDERSALVFAELLAGSQASILEIEAAQATIEEIGLDNYLAAFL